MASLEPCDIAPGALLRVYTPSEVKALVERWWAAFGVNGRGVNSKAYMWHVFCGGVYPAAEGAAALALYREQGDGELVVLSNDRQTAALTDRLPTFFQDSDWFVFPPNLAWTMAFTHEDGALGPYFAKHADYERLERENREREKKRAALEHARRQGWA